MRPAKCLPNWITYVVQDHHGRTVAHCSAVDAAQRYLPDGGRIYRRSRLVPSGWRLLRIVTAP